MINVALLSVIRRWHLREQVAIREIARRTGLSRNTVKKYRAGLATARAEGIGRCLRIVTTAKWVGCRISAVQRVKKEMN